MRHPGESAAMARAATPAGVPLSLVAVELAGGEALRRCLGRLAAAAAETGAEVVVVRRDPGTVLPDAARVVEAAGLAVPVRRALGVAAAAGPLVALVEDTTLVGDGWATALLAAFEDADVAAASGPVAVDPALPARYRALGRLEYGRFAAAPPAGGRPPSGNAMAFRRAAVEDAGAGGIVEHETAAALLARGARVAFVPGMACVYAAADRHGARLGTRFGHGRLYGAAAAAGRPFAARALGAAARAALLPGLLVLRALREARGAAVPWRVLGAELPWIAAMAASWSLGEAAGRLAGEGRAGQSWR